MAKALEPMLSILPTVQRRIWNELAEIPNTFVLCGGTAIALQLGHRASLDFDFITPESFDPDVLYNGLRVLSGSAVTQKSANTLTCEINRGEAVQISFFGTPNVRLVELPLVAADIGLAIASLLDLAGMKAAVVQKRAEAKDYVDLDAIITQSAVDLPHALAAGRALYGPAFNPELTLKSLCYFGDGNLPSLPKEIRNRLSAAVRAVRLDQLPTITRRPT
jgi:hypothetical protein